MFTLNVAWWELVVRALATYVFMIVLRRLTGKRQVVLPAETELRFRLESPVDLRTES